MSIFNALVFRAPRRGPQGLSVEPKPLTSCKASRSRICTRLGFTLGSSIRDSRSELPVIGRQDSLGIEIAVPSPPEPLANPAPHHPRQVFLGQPVLMIGEG